MSEIIDKIQKLETTSNNNRVELAKLEERKKTVTEEINKILTELKELNIEENDLEPKIIDMEQELEKEIERIKEQLL